MQSYVEKVSKMSPDDGMIAEERERVGIGICCSLDSDIWESYTAAAAVLLIYAKKHLSIHIYNGVKSTDEVVGWLLAQEIMSDNFCKSLTEE